jgi:hypothetical protein
MSLRTRLIIAFLLLSVLPLSAVTFFSYTSAAVAFERAARREATDSAADISRRMEMITADVGRRMDRLFETGPASPAAAGDTGMPQDMRARVAPLLGDAAAFVDRLEFHPMPEPSGTGGATSPSLPGAPRHSLPAPPVPGAAPTPPVLPPSSWTCRRSWRKRTARRRPKPPRAWRPSVRSSSRASPPRCRPPRPV